MDKNYFNTARRRIECDKYDIDTDCLTCHHCFSDSDYMICDKD